MSGTITHIWTQKNTSTKLQAEIITTIIQVYNVYIYIYIMHCNVIGGYERFAQNSKSDLSRMGGKGEGITHTFTYRITMHDADRWMLGRRMRMWLARKELRRTYPHRQHALFLE